MSTAPVIILIGNTHSGRTTFGHMLKASVTNLIIIETDPIRLFLQEQFPEIARFDDQEHTGAFVNVSLKFRIFESILLSALRIHQPIILSNANIWKESRRVIIDECKKAERKTIGVFLDFPSEVLKERALVSKRDSRVLRSRNFEELIEKQIKLMQKPMPEEFDEFFWVHTEKEYDEVLGSLVKKLV